ncbi:hypothetical protein GCM10022393_41470 [Aquimarina addita]|uniref:PH domain-containing protein n=2 Tax=Aquimarina addita TaxID=870485 RepID=A0ABP6UX84_9FLAO
MLLISKSYVFAENPTNLAIGITGDLLITAPLVYFLLIRKTSIPRTTIVPFLIACIVICSLILPSKHHYYLNLFKFWVLPVIELSVVTYVIYTIRKAIKNYKSNVNQSFDFFTTLKNTCYEILPKGAVIPVVTEIAIFYYGFIYWKKRDIAHNEFTYHKHSGTITLLIALIGIIAIETFVLHILLAKWNTTAAWVLTALSIYSGIQIFGFLKSMLKRPISIEHQKLYLKYGIMTETVIALKDIDHIEISSNDIELTTETRKLSFLGTLESHNLIIHLKKENTLIGLYGLKRKYKSLVLYVDDKLTFKNRIDLLLQSNSTDHS